MINDQTWIIFVIVFPHKYVTPPNIVYVMLIILFHSSQEIYNIFPATVRDWNALSPNVKNTVDREKLREALAKEGPCRNQLHLHGYRQPYILHSRIQKGGGALDGHLYNYHALENPCCDCGAPIKDSFCYFVIMTDT